jgi:hypothetical protein
VFIVSSAPPTNMKKWTVCNMGDFLNAITLASIMAGQTEVAKLILLGLVETIVCCVNLQDKLFSLYWKL